MKKFSFALVLLFLFLAFSACGIENTVSGSGDYLATSTVNAGDKEWNVSIGIKEALLSCGDLKYTLTYGTISALSVDFLDPRFDDFNFDTNADFGFKYVNANGSVKYYRWIFDTAADQFVFSDALASLNELTINAEKKVLTSTADYGYAGKYTTEYIWSDGELYAGATILSNGEELAEEIKNDMFNNDSSIKVTGIAETNDYQGITEGKIFFGDLECTVYQLATDFAEAGYLAVDSDGQWYADIACNATYYTLAYMPDSGYFINSIRYVKNTSSLTVLTIEDWKIYDEDTQIKLCDRIYCTLAQNAELLPADLNAQTIASSVNEKIAADDTISADSNLFAFICNIYNIDSSSYLAADGIDISMD